MLLSCFQLMLPFDILLRKYLFRRTNRQPESLLGAEFLIDSCLFVCMLIWVYSFSVFGRALPEDQIHLQFKQSPLDVASFHYMLAIISSQAHNSTIASGTDGTQPNCVYRDCIQINNGTAAAAAGFTTSVTTTPKLLAEVDFRYDILMSLCCMFSWLKLLMMLRLTRTFGPMFKIIQ